MFVCNLCIKLVIAVCSSGSPVTPGTPFLQANYLSQLLKAKNTQKLPNIKCKITLCENDYKLQSKEMHTIAIHDNLVSLDLIVCIGYYFI